MQHFAGPVSFGKDQGRQSKLRNQGVFIEPAGVPGAIFITAQTSIAFHMKVLWNYPVTTEVVPKPEKQ